jgi:hypothetical protein
MKPSLKPAEHEIVQGVFKQLAQAPWFDRTASNEMKCAKQVLKHYSAGATNPLDLLAAFEPEARQRYGIVDANSADRDLSNATAPARK